MYHTRHDVVGGTEVYTGVEAQYGRQSMRDLHII